MLLSTFYNRSLRYSNNDRSVRCRNGTNKIAHFIFFCCLNFFDVCVFACPSFSLVFDVSFCRIAKFLLSAIPFLLLSINQSINSKSSAWAKQKIDREREKKWLKRVLMVHIDRSENKDERHDRTIISINTFNDISTVSKRMKNIKKKEWQ